MTKVEVAKNLLQDKTCENCKFRVSLFERSDRCYIAGFSEKSTNFSESLTCEFWEKIGKYYLPFIRATFPSLTEEKIVSVQPMQGPTGTIFYLEIKKMSKIEKFFRKLLKRKEWILQ